MCAFAQRIETLAFRSSTEQVIPILPFEVLLFENKVVRGEKHAAL